MGASHFKDGLRATYDPKFYQEVASGRRSTFSTCSYLTLLVLLASAVAVGFFSIRLTPALTNFNFYDFGKEIQDVYPTNLTITLTPQLSDMDVTETLPPKLTVNQPYPVRIPLPKSLRPVVRGMCGASSAGSFVSSILRRVQNAASGSASYPELSFVSFLPTLPDGEYPQAKLDAMCLENKSLFVFTETGMLMCPPQLYCPAEQPDQTPSFRASFWTIFPGFTPAEEVSFDRATVIEWIQVVIDFPLVKILFGYRMLGVIVNLIMYTVATAILGTLTFWFWLGLTISSWIGLHVLTCARRNFPIGGIAQVSVYSLTSWLLLSVATPSLIWWVLPYLYIYVLCLFKVHFSTPPSPAPPQHQRAR